MPQGYKHQLHSPREGHFSSFSGRAPILLPAGDWGSHLTELAALSFALLGSWKDYRFTGDGKYSLKCVLAIIDKHSKKLNGPFLMHNLEFHIKKSKKQQFL